MILLSSPSLMHYLLNKIKVRYWFSIMNAVVWEALQGPREEATPNLRTFIKISWLYFIVIGHVHIYSLPYLIAYLFAKRHLTKGMMQCLKECKHNYETCAWEVNFNLHLLKEIKKNSFLYKKKTLGPDEKKPWNIALISLTMLFACDGRSDKMVVLFYLHIKVL